MRMNELGTLRETVQALRERDYPDLPTDLVDKILDIEAGNVEDRGRARDLVTRAVNDHLQDEMSS